MWFSRSSSSALKAAKAQHLRKLKEEADIERMRRMREEAGQLLASFEAMVTAVREQLPAVLQYQDMVRLNGEVNRLSVYLRSHIPNKDIPSHMTDKPAVDLAIYLLKHYLRGMEMNGTGGGAGE